MQMRGLKRCMHFDASVFVPGFREPTADWTLACANLLTQPRSQTFLITCDCAATFEVAHFVVHIDARELVEDGKGSP